MNYKSLIRKINRSQALLDAMYQKIAEKHGLTYNALMVVYIFSEESNITQKSICDEMYLPKSTVHSIVLDLMKKDLCAFSDKKIGKEKVLLLTESGASLAGQIMEEVNAAEMAVLHHLGEDDCKTLESICDRLFSLFREKEEGALKPEREVV